MTTNMESSGEGKGDTSDSITVNSNASTQTSSVQYRLNKEFNLLSTQEKEVLLHQIRSD